MKKIVPFITLLISLFLYWFIFRPPINLQSGDFWLMIIVGLAIAAVVSVAFDNYQLFIALLVIAVIVPVLMFIVSLENWHANALHNRLDVKETKEFTEIVEDFEINSIPRIDKSTAQNLANRKLGELEDVISQFEVDKYSTLINYNNTPCRVIPLKYADFMKFLNNRYTGIPGYILVDLITQEASYVKLDEGIKYSPSASFSNNLNKRIKSVYPTAILGEYNFEIDDNGTPYWIVPEIKHNFAFGVDTVEYVIVVNAITGDVEKHPISDVPEWIDRALDTALVLEQINDWGQYANGWLNSAFGQKGVKVATDLYNFIIQDNDVYLYTGITSANGSDQSNIGFFLVNMRTGEAKYTSCASVNESSAKVSAETIYQEKNYIATDPLLLNVDGNPTYFTSLKDNAGLVKVYALVCATEYKIVGYASEQEGMEKAIENYKLALEGKSFSTSTSDNPDKTPEEVVTLEEVTFKVEALSEVVVNGTTSYYIASNENIYIVPITSNAKDFMTINVGDEITAQASFEETYYLISSFEVKHQANNTEVATETETTVE